MPDGSAPCTGVDAWPAIKALIPGIQDNVKRLVLTFTADEAVIAEVEYYPDIAEPDTLTERFKLVPLDNTGEGGVESL